MFFILSSHRGVTQRIKILWNLSTVAARHLLETDLVSIITCRGLEDIPALMGHQVHQHCLLDRVRDHCDVSADAGFLCGKAAMS